LIAAQKGSGTLHETSQNVSRVTEAQFAEEIEKAALPVVADFYAAWCGPCKLLAPRVERLAAEFTGRIKFVKVNVGQERALAERFQVESVPTLLFFEHGKLEDRHAGLLSEDALKKRLESLLK